MSKSDKKKNQQANKSGKEAYISLANLITAKSVTIELPSEIQLQKVNQPLLKGYLSKKIRDKKIQIGQNFVALFMGKEYTFQITQIDNNCLFNSLEQHENQQSTVELKQGNQLASSFIVTLDTLICLNNKVQAQQKKILKRGKAQPFYSFQEQIAELKNSILESLYQRQNLIDIGLNPLKGILISGFSGAGKSALLNQVQNIFAEYFPEVRWKNINSVQMLSKVVGGTQQFVRNTFRDLKEQQPCVLAIEDIHLIFGEKQVNSHETALAALLSQMDSLLWQKVFVIASYNSDRDLTRNIRASGKFQKEIVMNFPNHKTRFDILRGLIQKLNLKNPVDIEQLKRINLRLNGFSVGQIKQILRDAYCKYHEDLNAQSLQQVLKRYRPTQIKQLIVEVPEVHWNQIGGYQSVKKQIKKVVMGPLQHSDKFLKFGIQFKGILLYGPPGCSKTMMAKAIATESKLNFIGIKGPQIFSKYVGESERTIRNIFKRARACSPCVIFFDEIDSIASKRSSNTDVSDRVLCQLLNQMDGIESLKQIAIVAATNQPQIIDAALMRPGRFDYKIYVGPPDEIARKQIFKIYLKNKIQQPLIEQASEEFAKKTDLYTGAEIHHICCHAASIALAQDLNCQFVLPKHLEQALATTKKQLTQGLIFKFEQFK